MKTDTIKHSAIPQFKGPPSYDSYLSAETWHLISIIIVFIGLIYFIIAMTKLFMDYRLKSKMIEKGYDEQVIGKILGPSKDDTGNPVIRWIAIFTGLGAGLLLIALTQPLGIHSLAILSLSLAACFLGYNYYIRSHHPNN